MARSSSIGGIFAELALRDSKFTSGLKGAGGKLKAFGASASRYGAMAGAALGAGLAVGVKHAIDMGGQLTDLSAQTGVAIGDLMRIQQAYKDNGKAAGDAGKDINKMQKSIAAASADEGGAADPFAKMGLSARELMAMNPSQQFFAIGAAIQRIQNPTEKTAAAMEVFGRSGGELLAVFAGSDMDSVNRSLGKMPEIMQEFAAELDLAGDILGRLPNKSDQFFTGFSAGIIKHIIPSLQSIDEYDFTITGQNIGNAIGSGISDTIMVWSTLINTMIDGITATAGDGFNFDESWNKYANASDQIRKDQADKLAKALGKQEERELAKSKIAESEINPKGMFLEESEKIFQHYEDLFSRPGSPITGDPTRLIETEKKISANLAPEFDSYQSRGLSLSANPQADSGKKMLDVQIEIRRILERFTMKEGGLNWT